MSPNPTKATAAVKDTLVTITSSSSPIDAHLAKNKLESEGILSFLFDENLVSMNPLLSNLVGGIKLKTLASDAEQAMSILAGVQELPYTSEQDIPVSCPRCGSTSLTYAYDSVQKTRSFFRMVLAFLTLSLPLLAKDQYQCGNCGKTFPVN